MYVCCSVKINGIENVKSVRGNAIVASNHVTELDPLMIVACLPFFTNLLPLIYVVKAKKFYSANWKGWRKTLYGGTFFRIIGGYEVYAGQNNYEKALVNHLQALDKGLSVCIFPVGRWHKISEYSQAKGGVAYLAAKTGKPIIPVRIDGIDNKTSSREYLRRKPKLTITFGAPLTAEDIFKAPVAAINEKSQKECEQAAVVVMKKIAQLT